MGVGNIINLLYVFIGSNRFISMVYANTLCGTIFCLGLVLIKF